MTDKVRSLKRDGALSTSRGLGLVEEEHLQWNRTWRGRQGGLETCWGRLREFLAIGFQFPQSMKGGFLLRMSWGCEVSGHREDRKCLFLESGRKLWGKHSDVAKTVEVGNPVFIYNDGNLLLSPSRTPSLWLHPGLGLGAAEDQARDFRAFTRNGL